jgi:hypothetical protein
MSDIEYAYLAGAMDSDGYFTIKKSTYHKRVRGDAVNPVYSEKLGLQQITPQVPELLKSHFGGSCGLGKPGTPNSKPLYRWGATDVNAAVACAKLLPFLRIKVQQAKTLLELRESKADGYSQLAFWFVREYPDWKDQEMVTTSDAMKILGYSGVASVFQAINNKTLLALPYLRSGAEQPRIPRILVEQLAANRKLSKGGRQVRPSQLIEWRERLYERVRELNKIGINGTEVYHRTGYHARAE